MKMVIFHRQNEGVHGPRVHGPRVSKRKKIMWPSSPAIPAAGLQ